MSMINKRVFGADIPIRLKKILEARQRASSTVKSPNEEIKDSSYKDNRTSGGGTSDKGFYTYGELLDNQFDGSYELGSRSPFSRMWTAVNLLKKTEKREYIGKQLSADETLNILDRAKEIAKLKKKLELQHPKSPLEWDSQKKQFFISTEKLGTTKRPIETKIYQVNSNDVGTLYPNEERYSEYSTGYEILFPDEHNVSYFNPNYGDIGQNNEFLKPAAGITSITSETEGAVGEIKKTTVNFEVHNFYDYDKIYNRFFLKPGAQIFVDFGWANEGVTNETALYPPELMLGSTAYNGLNGFQNKLFDKNGWVGEKQGLVDTVVGVVQDYESKIKENGSVECSVTIVSRNSTLLNYDVDDTMIPAKVSYVLDHLITFEGLYKASTNQERNILTGSLPDWNTSTNDIQDFQKTITALARKSFGYSESLIPGAARSKNDADNPEDAFDLSIPYGIFLNHIQDDQMYISWGLFEDKVINAELGHGSTVKDINTGEKLNFEISMNSQDSFTYYIEHFLERQKAIVNWMTVDDTPVFLYPKYWHDSYNARQGKLPHDADEEGYTYASYLRIPGLTPPKYQEYDKMRDLSDYTTTDIYAKRIPLREIFVRTQIIKDAFDSETSIRKVIEYILEKINEDSGHIFDWRVASAPGDDSSVSIIDYNYDGLEKDEIGVYDKLFTFDVMSNSSMVKGYDISLKIPDGDVGNMYAIQGLSADNQMFPLSPSTDKYMAVHSLLSNYGGSEIDGNEVTDYFFTYMNDLDPDAHIDMMKSRESEKKSLFGLYGNIVKDLNLMGPESSQTNYDGLILDPTSGNLKDSRFWVTTPEPAQGEEVLPTETDKKNNKPFAYSSAQIQKKTSELYAIMNIYSAHSWSDFYRMHAIQDYFTGKTLDTRKRTTPLPISAAITIYGISSIQPGDLFRLNYLPEIYRNHVYFQVVKVTQNVNSDGWYTTLETVMRIRHDSNTAKEIYKPYSSIVLAPEFFKGLVNTDILADKVEVVDLDLGAINENNTPQSFTKDQVETGLWDKVVMPEWLEDAFGVDLNRSGEDGQGNLKTGGQFFGLPIDKLMDLVTIEKTIDLSKNEFAFLGDEAMIVRGNRVAIQEVKKSTGDKDLETLTIAFPCYHLFGGNNTNFSMLIGYPFVRGFTHSGGGPRAHGSGGQRKDRCHDFWSRLFAPNPPVNKLNCISKYYYLYDTPSVADPLWGNWFISNSNSPDGHLDPGDGWIYGPDVEITPATFDSLVNDIWPGSTGTEPYYTDAYHLTGGVLPAGITIKADELYILAFNEAFSEPIYNKFFYMLVPLSDYQDRIDDTQNPMGDQDYKILTKSRLSTFDHNIYFQNFNDEPNGGSLMQSYLSINFSSTQGFFSGPTNANPCCWGWTGWTAQGRGVYSMGAEPIGYTIAEELKEWAFGEEMGYWVYDGSPGNYGTPLVAIPGDMGGIFEGQGMDTTPCDSSCPYYVDNLDDWWGTYLGGTWGMRNSGGDSPFNPDQSGQGSSETSCAAQGLIECWDGSCEENSSDCPEQPIRRVGCMVQGDAMYDSLATEACNMDNYRYVPYPTSNNTPLDFFTFTCEEGPYEGEFKCGGYVGHDGTKQRDMAVDLQGHNDIDVKHWCEVDGYPDSTGSNKENCCCVGTYAHS